MLLCVVGCPGSLDSVLVNILWFTISAVDGNLSSSRIGATMNSAARGHPCTCLLENRGMLLLGVYPEQSSHVLGSADAQLSGIAGFLSRLCWCFCSAALYLVAHNVRLSLFVMLGLLAWLNESRQISLSPRAVFTFVIRSFHCSAPYTLK